MIVPMKKLAVIVPAREEAATVDALRALGIVHIEHAEAPRGQEVSTLQDKLALIDSAKSLIAEYGRGASAAVAHEEIAEDWMPLARHIIDLHKRLDQLSEYARSLEKRIAEWECWGDFDPASVRALADKGVFIRFYRIPSKALKKIPSDLPVEVCARKKGMVLCAVICSDEKARLDFKPLELPQMSLDHMRARRRESIGVIEKIRAELTDAVKYKAYFAQAAKQTAQELEYAQALAGMGREGALSYLTGFIPYDTVAAAAETAQRKRWGLSISDPSEDDAVPTLIRNPRWVSIINPVFKLLEVIPGYRELDISLWFLLFFSVFFGMLIGDAGYGLVFFLATLAAQLKWGERLKHPSVFVLSYVLSACAIVWGALTGTFFGQAWLPASVPALLPALRSDVNLQRLCFLIGALHLSIAHAWKTLIKLPSLKALVEVGWISILWGAYFLARLLILGDSFPAYGRWLFIGGAACVILFTSPQRNLLKAFGSGFGNLLMNAVNNFTDIVSYIRLFAVGLAAIAVADAFNQMAADIGFSSVLTGLAASLVLILGHLLNLVLGPMSILVHGIRLNVLEFSTHLEMKWSGFAYKPLRRE